MYHELHQFANALPRYQFSEIQKLRNVDNGIYLLFEKGERYQKFDRTVRVGSHPSQGHFYKRLQDHFLKKQRASIFRKHIGRCLLHGEQDSYLDVWNFTNKKVKQGSQGAALLNKEREQQIEDVITALLSNFSIAVIKNVDNASQRKLLEEKLIASLAFEGSAFISKKWLGLQHPNLKIVESGLWNIQHVNSVNKISEEDLKFLKRTA